MGKLAKPQRSQKHKKIKSIDPFYTGNRKDSRTEGLNQKPKDYDQEIPKKLRNLGFTIDGVRKGKVGKKSKNKFHRHPDGPLKYKDKFSTPLGDAPSTSKKPQTEKGDSKALKKAKSKEELMGGKPNKRHKSKISEEVFNEYVDNLKPSRPFVDPFNFKKKPGESERQFNQRVDNQAQRALNKSKIDDHFDVSDEKRMQQKMMKLKKGMSDKKKQRLKEKKLKKAESIKEKKLDKVQGFNALQDRVEFGEVAHAPPVLSIRPKKAVVSAEADRPGRRMPELKALIASNMKNSVGQGQKSLPMEDPQQQQFVRRELGKTVKRKALSSSQKCQADNLREGAIDAYRQLKKKLKP